MSDQLWVIRAGQGARYVAEFEADSTIAVGFHAIATDDLTGLSEVVVRARGVSPADRTAAAQLVV